MFLFRFAWFVVTGVIKVTLLLGVAFIGLIFVDEHLAEIQERAGALIEQVNAENAHMLMQKAEDRLYNVLAERHRRAATASDTAKSHISRFD